MLLVAAAVFVYYTTWAIVLVCLTIASHVSLTVSQPFLPDTHPVHAYFLPREWAVRIPAMILVLGLSSVGLFVANVMVNEGRKKAAKAKATIARTD